MKDNRKATLVLGVLLVLVGIYFVLVNTVPEFRSLVNLNFTWPVILFLVAGGLLVIGALAGAPDMAIPAAIVGGIGGILYFQDATGNWGSWSYMWTLIPGFAGIGTLLAWLLGSRQKHSVRSALDTIGGSLVMFVIFGAFFGAFKSMGSYWPVLLIAAGVLLALRGLIRSRKVDGGTK